MAQRYFYGWNIVGAAIVIGFMTTGLGGYANGIILPHLADDLADGSRGKVSLAFSMGTILVAVFSPFVGRHADKNSPRNVMLLGACLLSLAYLVLASAQTMWQLILAKSVLYGAAISMVGPMVRNMTVAHWFTRLRGRALGFSVMGASVAGVLLPLILSSLVTNLGWRTTVYGFAGGVALILLPLIWRVVKDKPAELGLLPDGAAPDAATGDDAQAASQAKDSEIWGWKELLRAKPLWATGLTFGPMICVYLVIMVHLFGHAQESGLSDSEAALTLSVLAFASILFKPVIGFMADAIGARITLVGCPVRASDCDDFICISGFYGELRHNGRYLWVWLRRAFFDANVCTRPGLWHEVFGFGEWLAKLDRVAVRSASLSNRGFCLRCDWKLRRSILGLRGLFDDRLFRPVHAAQKNNRGITRRSA